MLLKLDTEGNELDALLGANECLKQCDVVIAEVTIGGRFDGGYNFEDIVCLLRDSGFTVHSILGMNEPPKALRQRYADVLFVRRSDMATETA